MNFTTAYCCCALRSYSSFPLAWLKLFPECLSLGINAIMILLIQGMYVKINSNYVLCNFIGSSEFLYRCTQCGLKSPDPSSTSWYWKRLVLQNGMGLACETIDFTVLLLGNTNIRSTTCDGVVINMWAQGNSFRSYACNEHDESHHCNLRCFYAMQATSMRAITVIWFSFLYSQTRPFIGRGGRVWVCAYIQVVPMD